MLRRRTREPVTRLVMLGIVLLGATSAFGADRNVRVGNLWDVYSDIGHEGWGGVGMVWPGGFWREDLGNSYRKDAVSYKAFLLGTKGWARPAPDNLWKAYGTALPDVPPNTGDPLPYYVVQRDLRGSRGEPFQLIRGTVQLVQRSNPSFVTTDGVINAMPVLSDGEDPNLPADAKLVSTWGTNLGITVTRTIYASAHPDHDDYHVWHYNFKNTGKFCCPSQLVATGDPNATHALQVPNLLFSHSLWYMDREEGGIYTGSCCEWSGDALQDYQGHSDVAPYPRHDVLSDAKQVVQNLLQSQGSSWTLVDGNHPVRNYGDLRTTYAYDGDSPLWEGTDFGDPHNITGRMLSGKWPGLNLVHCDASPTDRSDDADQPRRAVYHNWGLMPEFQNPAPNGGFETIYKEMMWPGGVFVDNTNRFQRDAIRLGQPYGLGAALQFIGPVTVFSVGGENWDLNPGEEVNVIYVSAVGGFPYREALAKGEDWIQGGGYNTVSEERRLRDYFALQDSLFGIFRRSQDLIEPTGVTTSTIADLEVRLGAMPSAPPNPATFMVSSGVERIDLSWAPPASRANEVVGYRLYRAAGSRVGDVPFELIYEGFALSFADVNVNQGLPYYYYLVTVNAAGVESSPHMARTQFPASSYSSDFTLVSGPITTRLWTKGQYVVTGTATVLAGNELAIQPGVDVLFAQGSEMVVEGQIHAVGTEVDSIRFLPGLTSWGGIVLKGRDTSTIHYARISGVSATRGAISISGPRTRPGFADVVVSANASHGVTLTDNAEATFERCTIRDNSGDGIYAGRGTHVRADTCNFGSNWGAYGGGNRASTPFTYYTGLFVSNATARVDRCLFRTNGLFADSGATLAVERSHFGKRSHVAVLLGTTASFSSCTFDTSAVTARSGSNLSLTACRVAGNVGAWSPLGIGAIWASESSHLTLARCVVANNYGTSSGYGGLVLWSGASALLEHCTVVNNNLPYGGVMPGSGGITVSDATLAVHNSVVWGGYPQDIVHDPPYLGSVSATYSVIGGGWPGTGNLSVDPLLVDPAGGDFRLAGGSPCIDAADPSSPLDPDGSRADMGAIPFASEIPALTLPELTVAPGTAVVIPVRARYVAIHAADLAFAIDTSIIRPALDFVRYHAFQVQSGAQTEWNVVGNAVRVSLTSDGTTPISLNDEPLVELAFDVSLGAAPGTVLPLNWLPHPATNINERPMITRDGLLVVSRFPYGDVTGDGRVTALDAGFVLRHVVGLSLAVDARTADVTGNGTVTSFDAAHILWKVLDTSYVFPVEGGPLLKPVIQTPRILSWERQASGWSLRINDRSGMESGELTFELPTEHPVVVTGAEHLAYRQDGVTLMVAFAEPDAGELILVQLEGEHLGRALPRLVEASFNEGAIPFVAPRPVAFGLAQNVPNPFNPTTMIRFGLPDAGQVALTIYDVNGRFVRRLFAASLPAGQHEIVWDGSDAAGRAVSSGVYLYRLTSERGALVRKMLLVR